VGVTEGLTMSVQVHMVIDIESELVVMLRNRDLKCDDKIREFGMKL